MNNKLIIFFFSKQIFNGKVLKYYKRSINSIFQNNPFKYAKKSFAVTIRNIIDIIIKL